MILQILISQILLIVLCFYWAFGIFHMAKKRRNYSHIKHSISELGESGCSCEKQVGYGLFLPIGLLLFVSAFLLKNVNTDAALLSTFMGCGYFFSAFFPCDAETPLFGTWKNSLHNIAGMVCYLGCMATLQEINSEHNDLLAGVVLYALMVFLAVFVLG